MQGQPALSIVLPATKFGGVVGIFKSALTGPASKIPKEG
jgi:hypothetical protein